jgi:hypothetical protein
MRKGKPLWKVFMEEEQMKHGGKRSGAGRKSSGNPLVNTSFRITPENWAYLQRLGGSKGKLINALVREHRLKESAGSVQIPEEEPKCL